jgi:hypothetical protein
MFSIFGQDDQNSFSKFSIFVSKKLFLLKKICWAEKGGDERKLE